MTSPTIRNATTSDIPAIKQVIDSTALFPSEMLDDMFSEQSESATEFWLAAEHDGLCAVVYCAPEPMTEGVCNLLLIAVHQSAQSQGIGQALMEHVEDRLRTEGVRLLLVETSGTDEFARTRLFYEQFGYEREARIRDYYDDGDDKIVFRKRL